MDIKMDYSMSYEEWEQWKNKDKTEILSLIDMLEELLAEVEDD